MHYHDTGGSYNVIFVGVAMLCGEIFTHCIEKNASFIMKIKIALLPHFLMVWLHFCCQPLVNIDQRSMACTILDSIRFKRSFSHVKIISVWEKWWWWDREYYFSFPTYNSMILPTHTNNSRHLYSIICRFVGECEGGFLLDKLGGIIFYLFCCVYFWDMGDRGG